MLVIFPVCQKDFELGRGLLRWCGELGPYPTHSALVVGAASLSREQISALVGLAKGAGFGHAAGIHQRDRAWDRMGWPAGPNDMFKLAVEYVAMQPRCPFFWCEPDAVPLCKGWLDTLEQAYQAAGKPYMGTLGPVEGGGRHLTGTAVYPPDVATHNHPSANANTEGNRQPFDTVRPELTLALAHLTNLIQHEWGDIPTNTPWTFPDKASLHRLSHSAVVFHRCKDGSLINQLRLREHPKADTCVICLGRYGDIIGALPIARDVAQKEGKPVAFMVAQEFADILDGVSYVVPHVYGGQYSQMPAATEIARAQYERVIRAQIYGTPEADPESGVPHNRRAWELAGYGKRWDDKGLLLEFDRRNRERERRLLTANVRRDERPILLLNLAGGKSGPFRDWIACQKRITEDWAERFQIVDLAKIKAERIYSLLGLMELAAAMVTIDTATVHLANACMRLPVLMLAPDNTYFAAEPRCNCQLLIRYSEWTKRYEEMASWLDTKAQPPEIVHAYEVHAGLSERAIRAQSTWPVLWTGMDWLPHPFNEPYPRDSREIGDVRGVPYVNDVLESALERASSDESIIVFTNDDVILLPEVHRDILRHMARTPALCSSRRDIKSFLDAAKQGDTPKHIHCGRDLFAFRAWWLRKHLPELPPLLLGCNDWDNVFINLIRREGGVLLTGQWSWEYSYTITDCEMASPNLLHEDHLSHADKIGKTAIFNEWNHVQLVTWGKKHCPELRFPWAEETYRKWEAGEVKFEPVRPPEPPAKKKGFIKSFFTGTTAAAALFGCHFIKTENIGDLLGSPLQYLEFGRSIEYVDVSEWDNRGDVVFGGGGMLFENTAAILQSASEDKAHKRVMWGVGTNYAGQLGIVHPDWLTGFDLVGLRDAWSKRLCPCPSCLHKAFDVNYGSAQEDAVVYEHPGEIPLTEFPKTTNHHPREDMEDVLRFLAYGRVVITNSYHGLYWASLLGRKVLCWEPNSNRFLHTPWPVTFCAAEDWKEKLAALLAEPVVDGWHWLSWARQFNMEFYHDAKEILT